MPNLGSVRTFQSRLSLPTSKRNGHVWIWQVVPHFKVKSGGFDAVVLSFECQKSLKTPKRSTGKNKNSSVFMNRTKVHNKHLGFIRKHTLNWHHLFLKAEFGPATSTSSLTYCTRALPYMCCCVVRWIVLQRGCQAAVINSDRNVSASCSNLQVSAIT